MAIIYAHKLFGRSASDETTQDTLIQWRNQDHVLEGAI